MKSVSYHPSAADDQPNEIMISIAKEPINVAQVLQEIKTPESGGIDVFIGTVRNHSDEKSVRRLEYTAYVEMAEKLMAGIEDEIRQQWPVHQVALVHRIGTLEIGDIAVVTAVSASHRAEAFEACRYAIEKIKAVVPIWKKEVFEGGEVWVSNQHKVEEEA